MPAKLSGYVSQNSDERIAIELITDFSSDKKKREDILFFYNVLYDAVRMDGFENYLGFYYATNILRKEFNLEVERRPGDFDIMFIPFEKDRVCFDRTAVFEVKIARPNSSNITKNSNSIGETQIYGLIEDGFPLIGLIHICMPEPLPKSHQTKIQTAKETIRKPGDPPFELKNAFKLEDWDWLPHESIDNQMKRMISKGFPKYIGINAMAITENPDGTHNVLTSREYNGFTSGFFNPKTSIKTIECVERHFFLHKEKRYKKLEFS
jgi:hypothetical protein